jgi:hypothetical protein
MAASGSGVAGGVGGSFQQHRKDVVPTAAEAAARHVMDRYLLRTMPGSYLRTSCQASQVIGGFANKSHVVCGQRHLTATAGNCAVREDMLRAKCQHENPLKALVKAVITSLLTPAMPLPCACKTRGPRYQARSGAPVPVRWVATPGSTISTGLVSAARGVKQHWSRSPSSVALKVVRGRHHHVIDCKLQQHGLSNNCHRRRVRQNKDARHPAHPCVLA